MSDTLAEYEDEDGTEYVVLDDPEYPDEEPRNARRRTSSSRGRRPPPRRRERGRLVRVDRGRTQNTPAAPVAQQPEAVTVKTKKVLQFIEVAADGMAELVPLPQPPPAPIGDAQTDLQNQNVHRHSLHSHRVLTNRIRTGGRVLTRVFELLLD